ncbi:MAG: permease, partial [Pseudohongiellaceae bacterium]
MNRFIRIIDSFSEFAGRGAAWLSALLVLVMGIIVALRYGFSFGSISLQESVIYINTLMVAVGAA